MEYQFDYFLDEVDYYDTLLVENYKFDLQNAEKKIVAELDAVPEGKFIERLNPRVVARLRASPICQMLFTSNSKPRIRSISELHLRRLLK